MTNITGEELAALLFNIHHHIPGNSSIIYYEVDLLPILEALGLPKPIWGGNMTLKQWKGKQNKLKKNKL